MPGSFTFSDSFDSTDLISLAQFGKGAGSGIDKASAYHMLGGSFHFANNDVSIAPIALQQGQTIHLDVDFGGSNNINAIDTEIRVVDALGHQLAFNDTASATDMGSPTTVDPYLDFTATTAGLYYLVVSQRQNDYIDDTFTFSNGGKDTGLFQLDVSIDAMTKLFVGTDNDDSTSLLDTQRRYDAKDGNDYVYASKFNTVIDGGDGDDGLYGSDGRDILYGSEGDDSLYGYAARDVIVGGEGSDYLNGDEGNDQLFGGEGSDYFNGGNGADELYGENGNDTLRGDASNDTLIGGAGNDYIEGGAGNDQMLGGVGRDTADFSNSAAGVKVNISLTTAQNTGAGADILRSIENVYGSNTGNDTIAGNGQNNTLYGNGGNDSMQGGNGDDNLYGLDGNDTMGGGNGTDYLYGYAGADSLTGGGDSDYFGYYNLTDSTVANSDSIAGFSHAQSDHISLSNIYSGTLTFIGSDPFSGALGELRVIDLGAGKQAVLANVEGNVAADFRILVSADATLVEGDFYL